MNLSRSAFESARLAMVLAVVLFVGPVTTSSAEERGSTRVTDAKMHARKGSGSYPYRARKQFILEELDIRPGDVVVDIGAGDGWWSQAFAVAVGPDGAVHAAEVDDKKVSKLRDRFKESPQVKPYRCDTDDLRLPERSCDLAFLSQTYHHLDHETRVEYLRRLREAMKASGRLAVIEKYSTLAAGPRGRHGTDLGVLIKEAEQSGWILVRCELLVGTYHYLTIFVQKGLFPEERGRRGRGPGGSRRPGRRARF